MTARTSFSLCLGLLLMGTALAAPDSALGQVSAADSPARAEAIRKYKEGSKAFEEKRYKDAIDLFLEADSFVPSAALAYNASVAYEAMGDSSSALRWSREYLRRAPDAEDRAQVASVIDRLESRLRDKGVQQVTILSTPGGATVLVDDRPVGVTPWTGDLRPGNHRVELRLTGHRNQQNVFELRPERSLDVQLALEVELEASPIAPPAVNVAPAPPAPPPDNASANGLTWAGAVALGVGVAGLGASLGLELSRAGAEQDARDAEFQVDAAAKIETMEDLQLGARIAVGIGGGLALAGGTMLIVGLVSHESEETPTVSAGCSDTGCTFALRGYF